MRRFVVVLDEVDTVSREFNITYRVPRLLDEDLGELDHVSIVVELLGESHHLVSRVLLVAGSCCGKECGCCVDSNRVALFSATCCVLN